MDNIKTKTKCPTCGDTLISLNTETGKLRCHSCRSELEHQKFEKTVTDISQLEGIVIGQGATAIPADTEDVLTFKCGACAAEVIVDTSESLQARCHWCRSTLSVNHQIPNGAVPDKVLPFCTTKENAQGEIGKFVKKRQFFAHPTFRKEFCTENVFGVYLPYMVIDVNASAHFEGQGEIEISRYRVDSTTYYEVDRYNVEREFDLIVGNLTIESNKDKLAKDSERTNNIVNAIKPFDMDNCVKWDANFMKGFSSQKRNVNVSDLRDVSIVKTKDIARHQILTTINQYSERGVRWNSERLDIKGKQWKAAYLPIWLYSYRHKEVIHYVAANGRNLKTMGSIPINWLKLIFFSLFGGGIPGGIIGGIVGGFIDEVHVYEPTWLFWTAIIIGFLIGMAAFCGLIESRYRNGDARFAHEDEANSTMSNVKKSDIHAKHIEETTDSEIDGRNEMDIYYDTSSVGGLKE